MWQSARRVLLAFLFLGCASGFEQGSSTPQQNTSTTFSARTDLVSVPVVVREGKQSVSGLTKADFVVLEDNVPQNIAFLKYTVGGTEFTRLGGNNVFTNQVASTSEAPRLTVIVLDNLNTTLKHQAWVIREVHDFLSNRAESTEPTAIIAFTRQGIRAIHDFTTDSASLLSAFEAASGQKPHCATPTGAASSGCSTATKKVPQVLGVVSAAEANATQYRDTLRVEVPLEGLAMLAQSLSGIPGRKTLLWITSDFPFEFTKPDNFLLPHAERDKDSTRRVASASSVPPQSNQEMLSPSAETYDPDQAANADRGMLNDFCSEERTRLRPLYERTAKQLADANVAVYPVDARGVVAGFPGGDSLVDATTMKQGTQDMGSELVEAELWSRTSMQAFAELTGAKPCLRNNDFSTCLADAEAASASYYLLGYYREKKDDKPGWRDLKVEVKRPKVEVLARSGYFYLGDPPDTQDARYRDVSFALTSPIDFSGVLFSVSLKQTPNVDPTLRTLNYELQIPASSLMDDPKGNHRMSFELVATVSRTDGGLADRSAKSVEGTLKPETASNILKNGVSYGGTLQVPPGELTLRFIVRDNVNGRLGSIVVPYEIQ
jgi:VWFA-related protein